LFGIVVTFVAHLVVKKFRSAGRWALSAGGLVAGTSAAVNTIIEVGQEITKEKALQGTRH
jgi:hypothetical protein